MKIIDYLENCKVGEIITNKRLLSILKRKGLIFDYSNWGYLESCTIKWTDYRQCVDLFKKGNAPKTDICVENESIYNDYLRNSDIIEYKGYEFRYKYLNGCFNAYLQLTKKGNDNKKVVNPRMSLYGKII